MTFLSRTIVSSNNLIRFPIIFTSHLGDGKQNCRLPPQLFSFSELRCNKWPIFPRIKRRQLDLRVRVVVGRRGGGVPGASTPTANGFLRDSKWRVDGDLNGEWLLLFYGLVLIKEKFIGCVWVITCGNSLLSALRHSKVPWGSLTHEHCRGFQLMVGGLKQES